MNKFTVCRDDKWYLAWPDVALTPSGKLVCIFSECTHHGDRSYTRIMLCDSGDRGRSWTPKRPLSEPLHKTGPQDAFWNCARVMALADGRLAAVADRVAGRDEGNMGGRQENFLWFSRDEGVTWDGPIATPVYGIVPDKLVELKFGPHRGRWVLSAHTVLGTKDQPSWQERCWLSDDQGATWQSPNVIASVAGLMLCEGSVLELPTGELVCFMRENSGRGLDCFKSISLDGGSTWEGPYNFPLPGCHRPVAGVLKNGSVLITHRFMQGGKGWVGFWTQNFFAALTDAASCLARDRGAWARILPVDYDRSPKSDTGYSGWVEFDDGEIYIVNYIIDDWPRGQIRGYSLRDSDFYIGK